MIIGEEGFFSRRSCDLPAFPRSVLRRQPRVPQIRSVCSLFVHFEDSDDVNPARFSPPHPAIFASRLITDPRASSIPISRFSISNFTRGAKKQIVRRTPFIDFTAPRGLFLWLFDGRGCWSDIPFKNAMDSPARRRINSREERSCTFHDVKCASFSLGRETPDKSIARLKLRRLCSTVHRAIQPTRTSDEGTLLKEGEKEETPGGEWQLVIVAGTTTRLTNDGSTDTYCRCRTMRNRRMHCYRHRYLRR